jgi:NAD(P)-dependent dehydrogenase (short-subunit alcohol dehydrogenase family)
MPVNPMALDGRTALVTGASSGIGRETAILLSQLGARVVLAARNTDRLEHTRSLLEGSGHIVEKFDFSELDAIPGWMKRVAGDIGPLDGVVHSAGVSNITPLRSLDTAGISAVLDVNLNAALMLARGFRQKGCHAATASLVLLSSVAGVRGQVGMSVYSASKAALCGVARSVALELVRDGMRVNCVVPGLVDTEMAAKAYQEAFVGTAEMEQVHPLGIGRPRDVANVIAFLLSDAARWITGSTLVVDGGYTA